MFMKVKRRFQGVPQAWTQGMPEHYWDAPALPALGTLPPNITQQRTPVLPYDLPPDIAQIEPQAPDLSYLAGPISRAEKIQEVEAAIGRAKTAMPPPSYEMLRKATLNPDEEAVMRMLADQGGAEYRNYIAEGGSLDELRRKKRLMILNREFATRFPSGRMGGPGSVSGPYGTVRGGKKLREAQELRGIRRGRVSPEEVRVRRRMRGAPDLSLEDLSAFVPPKLRLRRAYEQALTDNPALMMGGNAPLLSMGGGRGQPDISWNQKTGYGMKWPGQGRASEWQVIKGRKTWHRVNRRTGETVDTKVPISAASEDMILAILGLQNPELSGMEQADESMPDNLNAGQPPIRIVNPQTGERLISNDGGQTWQPAP